MANAMEIPNPGVIHSGEIFTLHDNESLYDAHLVIEAGGTLIVESGGSIGYMNSHIFIENSGLIENSGSMYSSIYNSGTINNSGYLSMLGDSNSGTVNNSGYIIIVDAYITNNGNFFNSGEIKGWCIFHNEGYFDNSGTIWISSLDDPYGMYYMLSSFYFTNSGTLTNSGIFDVGLNTSLDNSGTIENSGTISSNYGYISNGNGTINNCTTGIITGLIIGNPVKTVTCPGENVPVTSIAVTGQGAATTVENGKTLQMIAIVNPATATNKDVTWSVTSGTGTATISPTGLLTGTKAGTVTVKATAKDGSGVQGSLLITVTAVPVTVIPVTGIVLSEATTTVETERTLQMTVTVYPENATNKNVLWSVESITGDAIISETGLLTGKATGNVTVRVTSVANSNIKDSLNITVTAAKTVSSKSGGGGGGSGSSGEKTQNIALKDVSSIFVGKGSVRFDFKNPDNDIQYIEYTSLKNSGTITATAEVLKERSTFAASSPKGVIYRHINIWLGKTGYVTETNLESPVIGFRVDKSWIEDEGIDPASVVLNRYSGDKWNVLSTTQTKSDEKYYYYQAETPGFSPFAITGVSLDEAAVHSTDSDETNEHVSFVDLNGTEAQAEKNLPGLPFIVTLLIVSIACFLKRKQ